MTTVVVGCDINNGDDSLVQTTVVQALRKSGYEVEPLPIAPGPFADYDYSSASKGKIGLYIIACGTNSISDAHFGSGSFDKYVFAIRGDMQDCGREPGFSTKPIGQDSDCGPDCARISGKTFAQMNQELNPKTTIVGGATAEEIARNVVAAVGGKYNGTGAPGEAAPSNISPLLEGEMTFEELVGEICNGIDLMFLCKRSTVVVTDFETIFAEAKYLRDNHQSAVEAENVKLWQMEEDSYELEVNQHGFYNTVKVNYKDGTVTESYEDFVRVYGEVPITYDDPSVDKTTAIMKAKAYLAAHLRDLEMMVKTTMLTDADIDIGDIVTIENPMTLKDKIRIGEGRDPEYLFVNGVSTNWEGESYISTDLECKFSPTSPKKLEVPTAGSGGTTTSGSSNETSGEYNKCGVSSDSSQIMAIGRPSAPSEAQYGNNFYKSVFQNKCPLCGATTLVWDWNWSDIAPCKGTTKTGGTEGRIFCKTCDADFSCINGEDQANPSRTALTRVSGPDQSTEEEAQQLKSGIYKST